MALGAGSGGEDGSCRLLEVGTRHSREEPPRGAPDHTDAPLLDTAMEEGAQPARCTARSDRLVVLAVAMAALLALATLLPRATSALRARVDRAARADEEMGCERCPVGRCDRDKDTGECMWLPTYHCQVEDCAQVPVGDGYSTCWPWDGRFFYTFADEHTPCRPLTFDEKKAALLADLEEEARLDAGTEGTGRVEEAWVAAEGGATMKEDAGASDSGPQEVLSPLGDGSYTDPRLTAYWDMGDCGPWSDDFHIGWCGGYVQQPKCKDEVAVQYSVCASGRAFLVMTSADQEGNAELQSGSCKYVYFAQYACVPLATDPPPATTTNLAEGIMFSEMAKLERSIAAAADPIGAAGFDATCASTFEPPQRPPHLATDLNGIWLPDVCIGSQGPYYVYVIGDWGGFMDKDGPATARSRSSQQFVAGVDDRAQLRVAAQMAKRAASRSPHYIINTGSSFHRGGLDVQCGTPADKVVSTGQFEEIFEKVYTGPGLEGKPWLGVLGNQDYGGKQFDKGWDQLIAYTWGPSGRWIMPAQFWRQTVRYPGFAVDYFFVDSNYFSAVEPETPEADSICSSKHVREGVGCGETGPSGAGTCAAWFHKLWHEERRWLEQGLDQSKADWQIVVTHYPPNSGPDYWLPLSNKYGIDLFLSGHQHKQEVHYVEDGNYLVPTAWIVSGGGGGVTSERVPDPDGHDDQYGFFELTLTKEVIEVQGISHGGQQRSVTFVWPRDRSENTDAEGWEERPGKPAK